MTATQAPGAAPAQPPGPLARYHQALPDLADLLRGAGIGVGPDRWQNLYDLLLALAAQGRLPAEAAGLEPLIAPLLCRSEREQAQFRALFPLWLDGLGAELSGTGTGKGLPGGAVVGRTGSVPGPRLGPWLLALTLVLAAVVGGVYWYRLTHQPPPPPPPLQHVPAKPPEPQGAIVQADLASPEPAPTLALEPLPPRRPYPPPVLDPVHQSLLGTLGDLCLLLPGFFALFWLLLRWLTWRTVLERRSGNPNDPLTAIGLDAEADPVLNAPALREALRRLHSATAVPTRRLDADATVERTARHAGLFRPVPQARRRVPDLVVLCETRHAGDQMAGLAGQLVERLREAGLELHRYDYRGSPRRLVGPDGRWHTLPEVLGLHAGARLLVIGEPAALIDPQTLRPQDWTRTLAPWPSRGLLTTRRPPPAWGQALAGAGFAVAEVSSAGIQTLALHLAGVGAYGAGALAETTIPLPPLLQDARRWSQPLAPPRSDQAALLAALDAYLGPQGSELFATLAAYPQLHWGLTRILDLSLFPPAPGGSAAGSDPSWPERERRLLQVARLPWSRMGWLPDWLRAALLGRLDGQAERRIRRLYRELLRSATAEGQGRLALPVSLPQAQGFLAGAWRWVRDRGWRLGRWLRGVRALSDGHGVLNDAIFAGVLFGWRPRLLDFTVARRLLRRHLGGALGLALAPRILLAALLALGGAWVADLAWQHWLRSQAEPWLMERQHGVHGAYRVEIGYLPGAAALAEGLREALAADGFDAQPALGPLTPPVGMAQPLGNRVQWGDPADGPLALHIGQCLTQLAWGHEALAVQETLVGLGDARFETLPAPGTLRVLLTTPGATGRAFRDALQRALTAAEIAELNAPVAPVATQPGLDEPAAPPIPDPAAFDAVQARIGALERDLRTLEEELHREVTGADGRKAGYGPRAKALQAKIDALRDLRRSLQTEPGVPPPGQPFRDPLKGGGEGPEMAPIPGGGFTMGSPAGEPERESDEEPQHQVTVAPFALGRTEVTFADYDRFADATRSKRPADGGWGRGDRPVINVTWKDATAYADWLSQQTGHRYRLPSEAEWEYAARAGTDTPFWTGACVDTQQANYNGDFDYNGCGAKTGLYRHQTVPAGSLPPNPWGLHEVAGNAWEWVQDCWHDNYQGAPVDGSVWGEADGGDCTRRVLRGGSWGNLPWWLRSAFRFGIHAGGGSDYVGFRLARTF